MAISRIHCVLAAGVFGAALPAAAHAATATFDFEGVAATVDKTNVNGHTPVLSTLTTVDNGVDFTLSRAGGPKFDVFDVAGLNSDDALPHFPSAFGDRCINFVNDATATSGYFVGDLSSAASSAAVQFVIFGGTQTETLTGYSGPNGTGTVVATSVAILMQPVVSNAALGSVSITGPGIRSITVSGVNVFMNGTPTFSPSYLDNFSFTITPEPAALLTAALPFVGLVRRSRRRRP